MEDNQVVALGLLTRRDLDMLGAGFRRAFPLDDRTSFEALLAEIDRADIRSSQEKARSAPLDRPPLAP